MPGVHREWTDNQVEQGLIATQMPHLKDPAEMRSSYEIGMRDGVIDFVHRLVAGEVATDDNALAHLQEFYSRGLMNVREQGKGLSIDLSPPYEP